MLNPLLRNLVRESKVHREGNNNNFKIEEHRRKVEPVIEKIGAAVTASVE
jgi:hypothetical protein